MKGLMHAVGRLERHHISQYPIGDGCKHSTLYLRKESYDSRVSISRCAVQGSWLRLRESSRSREEAVTHEWTVRRAHFHAFG